MATKSNRRENTATRGVREALIAFVVGILVSQGPATAQSGIEGKRRIPWTTSRVAGSPDSPPPYRARRVFGGLDIKQPISVVHESGTEALLLVRQLWPWVGPGEVLRVTDSADEARRKRRPEVLLSLDRTIYGIALHPDYAKTGHFFLGSNGPVTKDDKDIPGRRFRPGAAKTTRISRFTVDRTDPFGCDPKSEVVILEWPSNGHNGGDLAFGNDGMLYVTSGDGTADSDTDLAGQDLTRLLGKVLRLDVDDPPAGKTYGIPPDNPFLKTEGAAPETWAYGFRNPWRLHVDRRSGDLWVGNNGQDLWEQIYLVRRGANYGWSRFEGSHPFYPDRQAGPTPVSKPIAEHSHSEARSLTGGIVYAGPALPELRGAYLYGDWSTGKIWGLRHEQGRVVWSRELAGTSLQISGFGTDSRGELLIVDYGGGLYQLERAPERPESPPRFPTRLSETGLFASVKEGRPQPGVIPYSVNAALWSDGAEKERLVAIPGEGQIEFRPTRGWDFPEGTVLVKTFSLRSSAEVPSARRIETRLLTRQQGQWHGYSYVWNAEQTDAELVPAAGLDRVFEFRDAGADGGERRQTWHFPSRAECMVCHSRAANFVLGLNVLQMNREHDYAGTRENQLRRLERFGLFRVSALHHVQSLHQPWSRRLRATAERMPELADLDAWWRSAVESIEDELRQRPRFVPFLPLSPAQSPRLVDPADPRENLAARARSYLHANCAQCHVTAGGGNSPIDLEFTTKLDKAGLIDQRPLHQSFGIPQARLIAAGHSEQSVLLHRLTRRGTGQMPPLATLEVDSAAVLLLRQWIETLVAEPGNR